ncbi:MAG: CdaR family protein [Bacilli bacterium]|nr:CdaR family protein [Bacilli bacterium]MDD3305183.1 CdaR family protein [Bacilli bacterium]MDD4053230.1 CdaR family protein [Bacilli bacterium]MDD4411246.1 CdaR family protein [Bacilli bacterium]
MKIINKIKSIFKGIGHFIDRYIIVPITKFALFIKDGFSTDNKKLEKVINRKSSLLILTLILAIGTFIAVDSKSIEMIETSAEVLYNQPVIVQYNEEAYVLEGVPEKVDITLIGRNSDLYLAKQISVHEIILDLSGLKPGVHKVALKYKRALDTIDYKLDPSVVTVTIYPKISEARSVYSDLLNTDNLDSKLVLEKVELERDEVIVKESEETIKEVSTIKALIDVNNFVDPKVGNLELRDIPLIAYDQTGNVIDVEIVPSKINAIITITSPQKTVPIKFVPTGTLNFGKAISTISGNINELTIYGKTEVLEGISNVQVEIPVNGLKESKTYNLTIKRPIGVGYMSEAVANVEVTVGDESTIELNNIDVEYENLGSNYTVNAKSAEDRSIPVIAKGVESVIQALDPTTIRAYVDLKGYGVGEHEVDVMVERTDLRVNYVPKVKKVTLVINAKK